MIVTDSPGWGYTGWTPTDSPGFVEPECSLTVMLGDLVFSTGADRPQDSGFVLSLHRVVGWDESADDRTDTHAHWSGDGDSPGALRWGNREIALEGLVRASTTYGFGSPSDAYAAIMRKRASTLRVSEVNGRALEADVRIKSLQMTRRRGWPKWADFTLSLVADDPLRHSSRQLPVQTGRIANAGDQTAWPLIAVSGTDAITITHPGGTFRLTGVPSHGCLIDSRNGEVWTASGQARLHGLSSGPWPRVEPGGSDWTVASAGTSTMTRTEAWS